RATGEPLRIRGGRLTPRAPALRASHSRACHHDTARHHGRSRPGPARPSPSAPGCAPPGRIEETPDNHLTAIAKRTRSGTAAPTRLTKKVALPLVSEVGWTRSDPVHSQNRETVGMGSRN